MKARSPGKLILSGEHAVVYGRPALVTAVNRYAYCSIEKDSSPQYSFTLQNIDSRLCLSPEELKTLETQLANKYQLFLDHDIPVQKILERPAELTAYALSLFLNQRDFNPTSGLSFHIESTIPIGCGMGSSAAIVLSVLKASDAFFQSRSDSQLLYDLALTCEKLQHGNPSGADPYICLHGGLHRFQNGQSITLPNAARTYHLVMTGRPEASTGECVSHVAKHFATSGIWTDFSAVARQMEEALLEDHLPGLQSAVSDNHALLQKVQVVPPRVASFIRDLENSGCAAKICGAGSVSGKDNAGVVWIVGDADPGELCQDYGYSPMQVEGDCDGTRMV